MMPFGRGFGMINETPHLNDRNGMTATALTVLSLGAGVQSTTLALMMAHGEFGPPDCAIFADTHAEPAAVYKHLDWLISHLPFPVHIVTAGNLTERIEDKARFNPVPFFSGGGQMRRQCTKEFKIYPIRRKCAELLGRRNGAGLHGGAVRMMIGISIDEVHRAKSADVRWIRNTYPLLDLRMTRRDCLGWITSHDYPQPPRSACIYCPYLSDAERLQQREERPSEFAEVVRVDGIISAGVGRRNQLAFIHRSQQPIGEVPLSAAERGQPDLFGNECEGMCGV
jgi:hypothetical protein